MSDDRPPSTDRWIAPLAIALVAEALGAGFPWVEKYLAQATYLQNTWNHVMIYLGRATLPALFGIVTLVALRKPSVARAAWAMGFVAILGIELSVLELSGGMTFSLFHTVSSVMIGVTTPVLWGAALARIENPGSPDLQKAGRVAAGIIQLGFVFRFVARIRNSGFYGSMGSSVDPSLVLWMLGDIVESLILLWATVESLRSLPDDEAARRRAAKTHKLMLAWVLSIVVASGVWNVLQFIQSRNLISAVHYVWTGAAYLTVQITAAFVVARRYRLQFPPSTTPLERSGGVVSTGEPA